MAKTFQINNFADTKFCIKFALNKKHMSTLIEKINKDFIDAFKAKKMEKKNFLGLVKGDATKDSKEPSDEEVIKVLKKFEKSLMSVIDANASKDFPPQDWNEEMELEVVQSYLPKQMTEQEIDAKLQELVDGGANHIGKIMGGFKGLEVDMKVVKEKADELLKK